MASDADRTSALAMQVLTFLIVDVRGYTAFTNAHGAPAAARLADRFTTLAKELCAKHAGEVIELRGDEALGVFSSPRSAILAAVELQGRCQEEMERDPSLPLRVGMGLDTGEVVPIHGGYRGKALNLAARLCSLAGPGEVFSSDEVVQRANRIEGLAYVERGSVHLKGFEAPIRVIHVLHQQDLPENFPPLVSLVAKPSNLPAQSTRFIGREKEVAEISDLLARESVRLLTLTGPGGTGKTRLALQVGGAMLDTFERGVYFVSLAAVADSRLVASAIGSTLKVEEVPGQEIADTLIEHLKDREMLLVLDNFEHLLDAASVVASLLSGCPAVKILVTSRISLRLAVENLYDVPTLAVPDIDRLPDLAALSQYDAVALFLQRAEAARAGFQMTKENAPAIAEICSRLDGLPLAIELAAARITLFSPQAVLSRLSNRLKLLTGGSRDLPDRQQTLRSTIDWSYSLLDTGERELFAHLSVFAGGCAIEAAEEVCGRDGVLGIDVFDGLASLAAKSLLRQEGADEPRLVMLETIREYAAERLDESREAESIRRAHASYFIALAEEAGSVFRGVIEVPWLDRLEREQANTRAALAWLLAQDENTQALRLVAGVWRFWWLRGHIREGRDWLGVVLARTTDSISWERATALHGASNLALGQEEVAYIEALIDESIALSRKIGDGVTLGDALLTKTLCASLRGDLDSARQIEEESLALARELGREQRVAILTRGLGGLAQVQGNLVRAEELVQESIDIHRKLNDSNELSTGYLALGEIVRDQHRLEEADDLFREGLIHAHRVGLTGKTLAILDSLARLAADRGRYVRAARLLGATETLLEMVEMEFDEEDLKQREECYSRVRVELASSWEAEWQAGCLLDLNQAVEYAAVKGDR